MHSNIFTFTKIKMKKKKEDKYKKSLVFCVLVSQWSRGDREAVVGWFFIYFHEKSKWDVKITSRTVALSKEAVKH